MSSHDTRLRRAVRLIVATGLVLAQARFNSALADSNEASSTGNAASSDNDESLPSVVVTALKRETVLQETPAAITALSGSTLHDANITDLNSLTTQVPGLVITTAGPGQTGHTGDRIPNIPEITATVGAQYDWALGSNLTALVRGDASYVGRSYTDFHYSSSTPCYSLGNYTVFNGRAGINKNGWGVYLYGNNLFNRFAIVSAANLIGGGTETAVTVPPRTIGVNLNKSF